MKASFSQIEEVFYKGDIALVIYQYLAGRVHDLMGALGGSTKSGSGAIIDDC